MIFPSLQSIIEGDGETTRSSIAFQFFALEDMDD